MPLTDSSPLADGPPPAGSQPPSASAERPRPLRNALLAGAAVVALAAIVTFTVDHPGSGRLHVRRVDVFAGLAAAGLAAAIGAAALLSLLRMLVRLALRLAGFTVLRTPARRRAAAIYLVLGLLEVGAAVWARRIEPFWIRTRHQRIELPGLRAPLRLAVISDVHSDFRFDLDRRIAERVNAERPDVILFLGDALNQAERAPQFRAALAAMQARYAKLAIRGNWDVWYWSSIDLFQGTGFAELGQGWRVVRAGPNSLRVGAHEYLDDWSPGAVVGRPPAGDGPAILLYHANDYIPEAARAGVDLYLSGDTHGGQVELPLWGPLVTVGRQGRAYSRGLYHAGGMLVYVTPGLGVERGLPFRLGVRPEVTVIEAVPSRGTP